MIYLGAAVFFVLAVTQSQKNILPQVAGAAIYVLAALSDCGLHGIQRGYRHYEPVRVIKKELSDIRADGILLLLLNLALSGVADALVSMLTLQSTMLASFQKTSSVDANRMNGITGLAVCVLISLLGVSLICYASKL